ISIVNHLLSSNYNAKRPVSNIFSKKIASGFSDALEIAIIYNGEIKEKEGKIVPKVILSDDSTCDLNSTLLEQYQIQIHPLHIILGEKYYQDGVDITPDDIYSTYENEKILPQTAAPNPQEYINHFKKWTDHGFEVVHINLGSGISSSHHNAKIAASTLPGVYVID